MTGPKICVTDCGGERRPGYIRYEARRASRGGSSVRGRIVWHDPFVLVRMVARHDRSRCGIGVQIERLMRHAGWNEEEIARFGDDGLA
jgi:hypothetical protein